MVVGTSPSEMRNGKATNTGREGERKEQPILKGSSKLRQDQKTRGIY